MNKIKIINVFKSEYFKSALLVVLSSSYPILYLTSYNLSEIPLPTILRPLILSIVISLILFFITTYFLKNPKTTSILMSFALILFYTYGQVFSYIREMRIFNFTIGRHRYLGGVWIVIFLIFIKFFLIQSNKIKKVFDFFLVTLLTLFIFTAIPITTYISKDILKKNYSTTNTTSSNQVGLSEDYPDIYYIVLDAYSRNDYLQNIANFDNSKFLFQLEDMGFFVSHCSRSNYGSTNLSIATTLNMNYVETFYDISTAADRNEMTWDLKNFILNSEAIDFVRNKGYAIVAFRTGYHITEMLDADYYFDAGSFPYSFSAPISKFEVLLFQNSGLLFFQATFPRFNEIVFPILNQIDRHQRDIVQYVIDNAKQVPEIEETKFVFVHIISPHPPYVFGENGEFIGNNTSFFTGYEPQIKYINSQVIDLINIILIESETPPIIIVQSDHGGPREYMGTEGRLANLSAIYFPGIIPDSMTQFHTPANNFRIIFNELFNESFSILDNKSFALPYANTKSPPPPFELLPNELDDCTLPVR